MSAPVDRSAPMTGDIIRSAGREPSAVGGERRAPVPARGRERCGQAASGRGEPRFVAGAQAAARRRRIDVELGGGERASEAAPAHFPIVLIGAGTRPEDRTKLVRRSAETMPLLVLAAPPEESGASRAMTAREHLVKEFQIEAVVTRLQSLLGQQRPSRRPGLRFGNVSIDGDGQVVVGGEAGYFQPTEVALLALLMRRKGKIVPKRSIEVSLYGKSDGTGGCRRGPHPSARAAAWRPPRPTSASARCGTAAISLYAMTRRVERAWRGPAGAERHRGVPFRRFERPARAAGSCRTTSGPALTRGTRARSDRKCKPTSSTRGLPPPSSRCWSWRSWPISASARQVRRRICRTGSRPARPRIRPRVRRALRRRMTSSNRSPSGRSPSAFFRWRRVPSAASISTRTWRCRSSLPIQGRSSRPFAEVGDDVKKGQILFTIESPDLIQAESTLIAAAGVCDLTTRALARAKELYDEQGIAQKDLEQAVSDQQTAEGALQAARDAVRIFGKTEAEIDRMIATRRKIDPTRWSCRARSPAGSRRATPQPGLFVQPGNPPAPYTVADMSTMWMMANVNESDARCSMWARRSRSRSWPFPTGCSPARSPRSARRSIPHRTAAGALRDRRPGTSCGPACLPAS